LKAQTLRLALLEHTGALVLELLGAERSSLLAR
jgi:hypothetical protein